MHTNAHSPHSQTPSPLHKHQLSQFRHSLVHTHLCVGVCTCISHLANAHNVSEVSSEVKVDTVSAARAHSAAASCFVGGMFNFANAHSKSERDSGSKDSWNKSGTILVKMRKGGLPLSVPLFSSKDPWIKDLEKRKAKQRSELAPTSHIPISASLHSSHSRRYAHTCM